jgi:aspartyl-tRNA(Asn)/glutamyl-tRNA(Gln) amidotransferase subunit A
VVAEATALEQLTIAEAAKAFRARTVSPVELTRHLLERSERLQETLHAFVTLTPEIGLTQARAAEAAFLRGDDPGPLAGVPLGYKDIYYTKGVRTTAGSHLHEQFVPDFDATTVRLLNEAGAVMLGKLTTWEFAGGGADITQSYFPSARNPWDVTRSPYGSSSGSGAAVAAGLVCGALGTDTGGSIRFPAAACGVAGHKPTYGLCSRWGVFPASWSLDHTGPLARTVEDCAIMLNTLAAYDPHDPASASAPAEDYAAGLDRSIAGLRVGLPTPDYFEGCHPEVLSALNASVDVLASLGAVVTTVTLPERTSFVSAEGHAYHRADLLETPELYGPNYSQRSLSSGLYFASEYIQTLRQRSMLKEQMRQIMVEVDVVVMPTLPMPAQTMEEAAKSPVGSPMNLSFARLFNQTGLPSLSIPNGFSSDGLPLSLLISGRPFADSTVLRVGHAFEQATDWHLRRPVLPNK